MTNELLDSEKIFPKSTNCYQNLDARGKPSTVFPRGRLVETERIHTCEALSDDRRNRAEPRPCDNRNTENSVEQSNVSKHTLLEE